MELPPVVLSCLSNVGSLQSSPGDSVFVLFPNASDKLSRETITAETPSWWRPTHPSLHTSNPLAAVYYTNKINTTSSCFSAIRSHFCWCEGLGFFFVFFFLLLGGQWVQFLAADLLEATSVLLCHLSFPCQIPWDETLLQGLCNPSSSSSSSQRSERISQQGFEQGVPRRPSDNESAQVWGQRWPPVSSHSLQSALHYSTLQYREFNTAHGYLSLFSSSIIGRLQFR